VEAVLHRCGGREQRGRSKDDKKFHLRALWLHIGWRITAGGQGKPIVMSLITAGCSLELAVMSYSTAGST